MNYLTMRENLPCALALKAQGSKLKAVRRIMKKYILYSLGLLLWACDTPFFSKKDSFVTRFEESNGSESATYAEVIDFYKGLSKEYSTISLKTIGMTDSGESLHLVIYSPTAEFNLQKLQRSKTIVLINNGSDAAASEGVDATMLLFRNLAQKQVTTPKNVVVVTIPVYNIGAAQRRDLAATHKGGAATEEPQQGNAVQVDLNADFIKADSENALSFAAIFHKVQPDLFIDNQASSGVDSQHVLMYSTSQLNKLGSYLGNYLRNNFIPRLSDSLVKREEAFVSDTLPKPFWRLIPLSAGVQTPTAKGYTAVDALPHTATGYAGLWNCMGITIATQPSKPYKARVEACYEVMKSVVEIAGADQKYIKELKVKQRESDLAQRQYPVAWAIDSTQHSTVSFYGYKKLNTATDSLQTYTEEVPYYNSFKAVRRVAVPKAYIVPRVWKGVVARLQANEVEMKEIEKDTLMSLTYYTIDSYKTLPQPYAGHYLHYGTETSTHSGTVQLRKGDYLIEVQQPAKRYLLEVLEPSAPDSFFNWNFFDAILRKEGGERYPVYIDYP